MHLLIDQEWHTVLQPQNHVGSRRRERQLTLNTGRMLRSRLMTLGARRMGCHLWRVLRRKLAILKYGEEQLG